MLSVAALSHDFQKKVIEKQILLFLALCFVIFKVFIYFLTEISKLVTLKVTERIFLNSKTFFQDFNNLCAPCSGRPAKYQIITDKIHNKSKFDYVITIHTISLYGKQADHTLS